MVQRKSVAGRRSCVLYAVILAALALIVAGAGLVLVVRPELDRRRQAEVRLEQTETHYQAGVAFQNARDWQVAETEFKQVIILDPDYKDVQARLVEVKARLAQSEATATAEAIAQAEQARADAQATATAQAQATTTAQAVAATATATTVETHYQKGLAYINLEKWAEAQVELEMVFEVDPSYKDVQSQLAEVEARLSEIKALTPTATPIPPKTLTPTPTSTPEIKSPSVQWLGFIEDQVSPKGGGPSGSRIGPDGNSDGVFELILPDAGRTITYILLATPDGGEHWETDGEGSWILGVVEQASGRRLDRIRVPMDYYIDRMAKLRLYASVAGTGFRPGQRYKVTVRFADGYSVEIPIQIP